jgi:hypothetical protein
VEEPPSPWLREQSPSPAQSICEATLNFSSNSNSTALFFDMFSSYWLKAFLFEAVGLEIKDCFNTKMKCHFLPKHDDLPPIYYMVEIEAKKRIWDLRLPSSNSLLSLVIRSK